MDKDSNAAALASKKPQWNGNAPNTEPAKPASPLAKQEVKNSPRDTKREMAGIEGAALTEAEDHPMLEGEAAESQSQKVRRPPVVLTVQNLGWCLAKCCLLSGGCSVLVIRFCTWRFNGSSFRGSRAAKTHHYRVYL